MMVENMLNRQRCKYCGDVIDPINQRCPQCGKLYRNKTPFKMRFIPSVITVFAIVVTLLCIFGIFRYQEQIETLKDQITEMESDIEVLQSELDAVKRSEREIQDKYREQFSKAYDLTAENEKLKTAYANIKDYAVAVLDSDRKTYHEGDCVLLGFHFSEFTVCTKDSAIARGLRPCDMCVD